MDACNHCSDGLYLRGESHLPPVACPLLVEFGGSLVLVQRTGIIENRNNAMEYELLDNNKDRRPTGKMIYGRLRWTYP